MKTRLRIDDREVVKSLTEAEDIPADLRRQAYDYFVKQTPIRTGNARRSTDLDRTSIVANYAYAERLDKGYSRQAPQGMTEPTIKFIEDQLAEMVRKIR